MSRYKFLILECQDINNSYKLFYKLTCVCICIMLFFGDFIYCNSMKVSDFITASPFIRALWKIILSLYIFVIITQINTNTQIQFDFTTLIFTSSLLISRKNSPSIVIKIKNKRYKTRIKIIEFYYTISLLFLQIIILFLI